MVRSGLAMCLVVHTALETDEAAKRSDRHAIVAGIPTYLIVADDGVPRRLLADDVRLE
jgi:hypothetical protein